jgi:hypothetical protein
MRQQRLEELKSQKEQIEKEILRLEKAGKWGDMPKSVFKDLEKRCKQLLKVGKVVITKGMPPGVKITLEGYWGICEGNEDSFEIHDVEIKHPKKLVNDPIFQFVLIPEDIILESIYGGGITFEELDEMNKKCKDLYNELYDMEEKYPGFEVKVFIDYIR